MNAHQRRIVRRRECREAEEELSKLGLCPEEIELWVSNFQATAKLAGFTTTNTYSATITISGFENSGRKVSIIP